MKASESIEVEVGEIIAVLAGEVVHEDECGIFGTKGEDKDEPLAKVLCTGTCSESMILVLWGDPRSSNGLY